MLTFRQLQAFYWVARLRGLKEASERLHVSHSALSKRLAEFESTLGHEVFDRSTYRLSLTRFGQALLEKVEPLLQGFDELHRLGAESNGFWGQISFGVTELVAFTWLPDAIMKLRARYPEVVPQARVETSPLLIERVRRGELSFAVCPLMSLDDGLGYTKLQEIEFTLMISPQLLKGGETFGPADVASHSMLSQGPGAAVVRLFDQWTVDNGIDTSNRVLATNSLTTTTQLVLAGLGVGFLPVSICRPLIDGGKLMMLSDLAPAALRYYMVCAADFSMPLRHAMEEVMVESCDFGKSMYASLGERA